MNKMRILLAIGSKAPEYYQSYVDAIESFGGEAIVKYASEPNTNYDGLLLCGGNDIHQKYYNEEINGSVNIDDLRDHSDFSLLKAFVETGKPVFGICRGYQLINIFFGGSLYQHIPEAITHKKINGVDSQHNVSSIEGSILHSLYGPVFSTNSAHHQAINVLGENLRATAFWNNQYIEAFEHLSLPIFGVQWHPERMCFNNARHDTVDGAKLFEHFISICSKHSK